MDDGAHPITEDALLKAMRSVIDPELGINVVDLGLVYSTEVSDGDVRMVMTMTTPSCPLNSYIKETCEAAIRENFPAARSVRIDIVWDPKWSPAMMSDLARRQLGWQ
jgi:metal-sulfur cluster biosynthetic enzyme